MRFEVARRIVNRAEACGISRDDVIIDPLPMLVGALPSAILTLFKIVCRLREEVGVNSICGASNISFGLPNRPTLHATFLTMAIANGMTCAITNPLEEEMRKAILAANVMMGHDENCQAWLNVHRPSGDLDDSEGSARRERRKARKLV